MSLLDLIKVIHLKGNPHVNFTQLKMKFLLLLYVISAKIYFVETFSNGFEKWIVSQTRPDYGLWKVEPGSFYANITRSTGLKTTEDDKY